MDGFEKKAFSGLALEAIQPQTLKGLSNHDLRALWVLLQRWFNEAKQNHMAIENIVNAAHWVAQEFDLRHMAYKKDTELAYQATHLLKNRHLTALNDLPKEVMVVRDFVSVVGSTAKAKDNPGDIDILFRAQRTEQDFLIQADNIWLPVRKVFDADKQLDLHFIDNPQGPHDDFVPVYDLVLRRHPVFKTELIKQENFSPPEQVSEAAKKGLALRERWQRGGLSVGEANRQGIGSGVTTAKLLAEKQSLSLEKIKQIKAFLDRHEKNYQPGKKMPDGGPTAGTIAYLLWGGPAAKTWTQAALAEIEKSQPSLGDVHVNTTDWRKKKNPLENAALKPIQKYPAQKPLMLGYTDFHNLNELWNDWGKDHIEPNGLLVSPKVDGFRTIIQKAGEKISIFFEDAKQERADELPQLVQALKKIDKDFIIEGELQAHIHNHYVARPQLLTFIAGKLEAHPVIFLYDLLYDNQDVHTQAFTQRLALLKSLNLDSDYFVILPQEKVTSQGELDKAGKRLADWQPSQSQNLAIEGIVVRNPEMPYIFGPTNEYVKTKKYVELKFRVTKVNRKENGYTYDIALDKDGEPFAMGATFVSKEKLANEGDVLNVSIEELILQPDGSVDLGKPTPLGPDKSRQSPYTVAQAIDLAQRFGVLKKVITKENHLTIDLQSDDDLISKHALRQLLCRFNDDIEQEILLKFSTKEVPPVGPKEARLAIVGDGPGRIESEKGLPWSGPSGKFIKDLLSELKVDPDSVWWANVYPTEAEKREEEKTKKYGRALLQKIDAMPDMKAVLALSELAIEGLTGESGKILDLRENNYQTPEGIPIIASFHPSALLRTGQHSSKFYPKFRNDVKQAVDLANAVHKAQGEEGDTRASIAEKFWKENWDRVYPKSGQGRFVYQHHWRGLPEDEKQATNDQLLNTNHSVHGDLRLSADGGLWGFTVFTGTAQENRQAKGGDRLIGLGGNDNPLRGTFKLEQPTEWLNVGVQKPFISEPGGVGSTSQKYSKFFALDHGTYEMGVRNRSFSEIFLHGDKLKGRYLIQNVPIEGNRIRAWMISKPADQKPFAETHDLQEEIDRLKKRGHKKLIWAKPGEKPQVIDLTKAPVKKTIEVQIYKRDNEKQLITGIVLEPDTTDAHGDRINIDEIEQAAHRFMLKSRIIGLQHREKGPVEIVESYVAPADFQINGQKVAKGSWVMTVKVHDNATWKQVKTGKYTGFSVGGMAIRMAA